jgi:uncharacterized protein with HEPN domain
MYDIDKTDRTIELFIFDVYIAIQKIKKASSNFDNAEALLYDFMAWDSVIREFEIIGEASKYLLKVNLLKNENRKIVDFRNQITHAYFGIDQDIVWEIIHKKLKPFEEDIVQIIGTIDNDLIEDNNYLDFVVNALKELV